MDFLEHLYKSYEKDIADKIIDSFGLERTHSLILNTNKYDESILSGINILSKHPFIDNAYYYDQEKLGNDYRFKNGVFYIQDASAMMSVHLLGIAKDDIVLDMCAAPGGKTIDTLIKLNNTGQILANELSYERAKILSSNVEKMGFCNVFVSNNDFSKVYMSYQNTFDKIILDAPCSGSFMFRKNELSKLDWNYQKVLACAEVQKSLINMAAIMLKPGGKMVYSTCSVSKEENEDIIKEFLDTHEDFEIVKIPAEPQYFSANIDGAIYLLPHLFKGEGQFICVLKKKGELVKINSSISEKLCKTSLFSTFGLKNFKNCVIKNDLIYAYNTSIKLKHLNIIRYGLHIGELKGKVEIPSFSLAHYLTESVSLNFEQFKKYTKGEEIDLGVSDGFFVVSYNGVNLGFVKVKSNRAKNYYPKGLRFSN